MDTIWQDIRQGARMMVRNPWFTAIAVLVLALGIGPNTAIFSVLNALLLTPLPYEDPDSIVRIIQMRPGIQGGPQRAPSISTDDFQEWRAATQLLEHMAVYAPNTITLTGQEEPVRLNGASVSPALFSLLRVRPFLGRVFAADNDKAGNDRVVLLSQSCWEKRFGANRSLIGNSIKLEGNDYMVMGVMPAGFDFPARGTEYWIPFTLDPPQRGGNERRIRVVPSIARLKPGVTVAQALAEGNALLQRLRQQDPDGERVPLPPLQLMTLQEQTIGAVRPALIALAGAVAFVLLIACANVASLLLTRATDRQREIAIRASLGAGRGRLTRQLLVESGMLSALGGGLGLLLGYWAIVLLPKVSAGNIPRVDEIHIDLKVLGFTLGLSLLTGLLFGLAPALRSTRLELVQALKEGGVQAMTGLRLFHHNRTRSLLAILEYALALVLLIGAGLLMNSFLRLVNQNPGYNPEGVLSLQVSLPRARYAQPEAQIAFYDRLLDGVRSTPGVLSAGFANLMPMSPARMQLSFTIAGRPEPSNPAESPTAGVRVLSPGFLQAMSIPVVQGRDFNDQDRQNTEPAVLVNQALVRQYFGGENPVGTTISLMNECRIIGVVGNIRPQGLDSEPQPEVYLCFRQFGRMLMAGGSLIVPNLVVRTGGDPLALAPAIRTQVRGLDAQLPVYNVSTLEQRISDSVAQPRFFAMLLSVFAVLALVLAMVGVYGLLSYHVAQSTREIGIRMALGAERANVFRLVLGQGMALAAIGIVFGIGGAWAASRFLANFLFGVQPVDPATYAGISVLMACVALLAAYVPARRATAVDPIIALRQE
jgi:putative ABC transport system permease protein